MEPEEFAELYDAGWNPTELARELLIRQILDIPRRNQYKYVEDLPDEPGIYFVVDYDWQRRYKGGRSYEIVYIGKSKNSVRRRWSKKHKMRDAVDSNNRLSIYWKPLDDDNFDSLEHEETAYIALIAPKYNLMAKCDLNGSNDPCELIVHQEAISEVLP